MTNFSYTENIPAAGNNPSNDQGPMEQNFNSNFGIWNIDHIGFNANNGGDHMQMHLPFFTTPTIVNGTATQGSVIYGNAGIDDAAIAQAYFINNTNTISNTVVFPLSMFKAMTVVLPTGATGNQPLANTINVTSVNRTAAGAYTVSLPANIVTSTNYFILIGNAQNAGTNNLNASYNNLSTSGFNIRFQTLSAANSDPISFGFAVIQM